MDITLQRQTPTQFSTPGTLSGVAVSLILQTLEPPPIPDPTHAGCPVAIPSGRFRVVMVKSPRFGVLVPLLLNVPGRSAIECHYGNFIRDQQTGQWLSEGCILVGMTRANADEILSTQEACEKHLWPAILAAVNGGEEVWLTVNDPQPTN